MEFHFLKILVKDFHNFSDRYFASKRKTDVIGSASIFAIDNPEWKFLRSKLSPAFTSSKLKKLFELVVESSENMKKYLKETVPSDEKFDLEVRNISSRYTTDVVSSLSFGIRNNSFSEATPEFYDRSLYFSS